MNRALICMAALALWGAVAVADSGAGTAREIIAIGRQAMDGWLKGNPDYLLLPRDNYCFS